VGVVLIHKDWGAVQGVVILVAVVLAEAQAAPQVQAPQALEQEEWGAQSEAAMEGGSFRHVLICVIPSVQQANTAR
jgi:hypothetical protein